MLRLTGSHGYATASWHSVMSVIFFHNTRLIVLIAHGNGYDAIDPPDIIESNGGFVSL